MMRFLAWLLVTAALFAGIGVPYHLYLADHPRKLAVAVDTSYDMQASRQDVQRELERLAGTRYAQFALITDKARVHGWQETLDAGRGLTFYGPRELTALADATRFPELAAADTIVVLTNANDTSPLRGLRGVRILP